MDQVSINFKERKGDAQYERECKELDEHLSQIADLEERREEAHGFYDIWYRYEERNCRG